jgi:hypothetical protein
MNRRHPFQVSAGGRASDGVVHLDPDWLGWSGEVAHPDAPAGGGGPGSFAHTQLAPPPGLLGSPVDDAEVGRLDTDVVRPPNVPPATDAKRFGVIKRQSGELIDILIELEVLPDSPTGGPRRSGKTFVEFPRFVFPGGRGEGGKVVEFKGKFQWKGAVTLQTRYGAGATATVLACYGRGTTEDDVRARDVTLGFHESCHRRDYIDFLKANPLPEAPVLKVGMTEAELAEAKRQLTRKMASYSKALDDFSVARTDEVGQRRQSDVAKLGCFRHRLR